MPLLFISGEFPLHFSTHFYKTVAFPWVLMKCSKNLWDMKAFRLHHWQKSFKHRSFAFFVVYHSVWSCKFWSVASFPLKKFTYALTASRENLPFNMIKFPGEEWCIFICSILRWIHDFSKPLDKSLLEWRKKVFTSKLQ